MELTNELPSKYKGYGRWVLVGVLLLVGTYLIIRFDTPDIQAPTLEEQYAQAKSDHAKAELKVLKEKKDVEREQAEVDEANIAEEAAKKKIQDIWAKIQTPISTGSVATGEKKAPAVLVSTGSGF